MAVREAESSACVSKRQLIKELLFDDDGRGATHSAVLFQMVTSNVGESLEIANHLRKKPKRRRRQPRRFENSEKFFSFADWIDLHPLTGNLAFGPGLSMKRSTFQALFDLLQPILEAKQMSKYVCLEKQLLMFIWFLATEDSYSCIGERFGQSKSTLHVVFLRVCRALSLHGPDFISWPEQFELKKTSRAFQQIAGLPGVVGCIGQTLIPVRGKQKDQKKDGSPDGQTALHMQACCDARMRITSVDVGAPESISSAELFNRSTLQEQVKGLPSQYHVLGDSEYPLMKGLMVPFDDSVVGAAAVKFNQSLSKTRATMHSCLELLRHNFQRLKFLNMMVMEKVLELIEAACVLHNIIIEEERPEAEDDSPVSSDEDLSDADDETSEDSHDESATPAECEFRAAARKRLNLAINLP